MKLQSFFLLFSSIFLLSLNVEAQDSLSYIVISDAPGGRGFEINNLAINAGDSLMLYAAGYDTAGYFIGDQIAKWMTTGSLDRMEDDSTNMFIFNPEKCQPPNIGTIIATVGELSDTTGIISVMGCGLCKIIIRDAPGGGGNEVNEISMTAYQEINLYAAGYDESDNYVYDLTAKWSTTGSLDRMEEDSTNIFIFTPTTAPTLGTIIATVDNMSDTTGLITVEQGELCYVLINGFPCDIEFTMSDGDSVCLPEFDDTTTAYVGDSMHLWAAGYDCNGNYITDVHVSFDSSFVEFTGSLDCDIPIGTGSSFYLTFSNPGQGRVILNGSDTSGVIIITENPASITTSNSIPSQFKLEQAYPNPFNPSTTIQFILPKSEHVRLEIYNSVGQLVETLVNWQMMTGEHKVEFEAKHLSSGVYYYRLVTANFTDVKKFILMK